MNRKSFIKALGVLTALAALPWKRSNAITPIPVPDKVPPEQMVSYLEMKRVHAGTPLDIPSIEITLGRAPASTLCNECNRPYGEHPFHRSAHGIRWICEHEYTDFTRKALIYYMTPTKRLTTDPVLERWLAITSLR